VLDAEPIRRCPVALGEDALCVAIIAAIIVEAIIPKIIGLAAKAGCGYWAVNCLAIATLHRSVRADRGTDEKVNGELRRRKFR
jgi:hypothetical protein